MANRYDIIHIDFQASARGANAAIESIRQEADKCNTRISELKKNIAEAPKGTDAKILEGWNQELKVTDRRYRQLVQAQKELMKGMRALDEGVKMFNDGSLSAMNAAFQKQVNNAAKLAQSKLATGTKEWRDMGALMQETEQNYARMMRDTDQLIESLQNGGVVFRKTLEDEKKGLQDLLQVLPYMGTEYRKAEEQLQFLVKTTDEMAIKERQLKGEIVTTDDARRVSLQLTKEGADAARQRAAAADQEIEKGKQEIETLEKEREAREANARASAQAAAKYREDQQMYEDEIDRLQREIKAEEERAASGKTGVDAMQRKAQAAGIAAEKEIEKQKKLDEAYETAKGKFMALREEYEKMKQAGASAPVKDVAASAEKSIAEETTEASKKKTEAKKEETAATKETTAAKKEEVQTEEQAIETEKKENLSLAELVKKASALREKEMALLEERKKLEIAQNSGVKTINEEAAAVEKEANAFANLTKEQAQALLQQKQMQATISKGADGKFAYSNAEEAQNFLIGSMRQVNPANAKGDAMSLDSAGVAKVRAMFKERYGLQSDDDALAAIRGLLSGENGELIKGGMMNNAFSRVDLNPAKVSAYAKEIKDLTAVVNGETEATKEGTKAVEENAKAKRTLADVDAEYEATTKEVREIMRLVHKMQDGEVSTTEKLADKTGKLAESHKKNAEAIKEEIDAIKQMNREQAEAMKKELTVPSTIGYKAGKLDVSNLEEVQHFLLTQISKKGTVGKDGTYSLAGQNVDNLLTAFQNKYGLSGKKQEAKQILKELASGKSGGLFQEGGIIDFNNETMLIKANTEAYQARIQKLKALIDITNGTAQAVGKSTEATKKDTEATLSQTDAIKAQEEEVKRRRTAFEKKNEDYEAKNAKLREMRSALGRLPKSGPDALLARQQAQDEIDEYNENIVKPARADKTKLKGLWEKSVKDLLKMQGQDTEETKKNTEAENQNAEATEKSAKGKRGKAKASEDSAKATKEETQQSAELLAKEKEMKEAEAEMVAAMERGEAQQKKTNKAVEDAETANEKAKQSEADLVKSLDEKSQKLKENKDGLEKLNEANKDTIATNEKNQQLLAETNGKIQEQGEKIRDAERIKAQAKTDGIEKTEQAIRLLTEENRHIDQNSFTWKRNTIEIQHLQEALDEMKGKPALMMMEQRMKNIGALSASALEETRRFWDTMAAGAEKGSEKLATAEANVKALVEEERKRSEEKASKVIGNMGNFSDKEISDAVRTFEQLRDAQTHGNEEWTKFNNLVQQGKQHLEELAKQDALTKMEANMSNLTTLSDAARAETKKFFETLQAGAEKGSEELAKAETHLKAIKDLEKGENEAKAQKLLTGTLSNFSESEIREYIDAAQAFRKELASGNPAAQRYADAIAKAEAHVKKYGVEAARAAQQQADSNKLMQDQLNRIISDKQFGIAMPTASQLKAQKQYWQRLIDDPKTAASSLQQFRDRLAEVEQLEKEMVEINGKNALQWFGDGKDRDASGNQIKEYADKLKEYRGTLLQETNAAEIQQIDDILQRIGASAKKASEELMDFEKAKELALQAGSDVYGQKNPSFLASPEEIQAATKSIEKYREELFKTIKQKKDMGEATDAEEAELQELAKYLKDLKFAQDNFNMSREKMEALMANPVNATSLDELRAAIKRADAELKRMEGSLGQNNAQYKAFAEQVRNAKNQLKEMEGQAKASATAWEKAWSRLKTYVVMYMGFNAVWQKMTGTADDLMQLSDKMGEVRKTTGFTADEVGRLSDELKKLDTRTTITGLLDLSVAAGQLGLKTQEDVEGFTIAANKLMVALPEMGKEGATEMLKVALATGEIDKIRKQMEQGLIDGSSATAVAMEKVGSTIDRLRATSAATAPAITDFVKRVGAVGAQSGISIDQVAALGSTVDALGMRVEMSATALSRMIPAIKNNAFDVAKAIGVAPNTLRDLFEAGRGMEAVLMIFQKIKDSGMGADDIDKMLGMGNMKEVMKELNQQGARAGIVFAGLSQNVDTLREHLNTASKAYEENIAIQQEYDKMNETTAAKLERLKNYLEELFVSDASQRLLGGLIDGLRTLVEFLADSGPIAKGLRYIGVYLALLKSKWAEAFGKGVLNTIDFFKDFSENMESLGESVSGLGSKILPAITSVKGLKAAWKGLNAEMKANIISAVATAIVYLGSVLWDWHQAAKEAAEEQARFNDEIAEEQKALKNLMEPLKSSNLAQEERSKLISDINSKYGKYLGYMLSETSTAIQLADAHALIAKRIKEEAYQRRLAEQESKVRESYESELNSQYGTIISRVRSGRRGEADVTEIADILKAVVTNNISKYNKQQGFTSPYGDDDYWIDPKMKELIDNTLTRLNADGKVWSENLLNIKDAVYRYAQSYGNYHGELMRKTGDIRSDLRTINTSIKTDLTNNLNGLVGRIINFGKKTQTPSPVPAPVPGSSSALTPVWQQGNNGSTGWGGFPWNPKVQHSEAVQMPAPGWKLQVNEKNIDEVRQFVEDQDNLRNFLKDNAENISEQSRATAEAYLVSENELKRLRKLLPKENGGGGAGGGGTNPWGGNAPAESTDYATWDVNELVARRNQMDKFKNVLKPDTDIRAVLAEDKALMKALDNGLKEDWKSVLGWYNTERKKIQEELKSERFSTNEGHWRDKKQGRSRKNHFRESDYALAELDRYYSKRKEELEKARIDENMSEELFNRQAELLEQEHLERRSKLRETFTAGNTKAEKEMVKQFRNWWSKLEKEGNLDEVPWATVESEWAKALASEIGRNNLKAQQDLTQMQQITVKHLNKIADIIAKERPYDGIVDNLRKNLTEMDILFADMEKKGATDPATLVKEQNTRLQFLLGEAETAYQSSIDEVLKRMADAGMTAWAEEIGKSDAMKNALMAQLQTAYDEIQNAIKKEASQIKKQTDIWWNDLMPGQDTSRKGGFEKMLTRLGLQEDQVKRANALIGAGAASERVADKLAIKQMQIRLQMQQVYYQKMRQMWDDRIRSLREQGKEIDAQHAEISKQLSLSEEQKKLDEQRVAIANQLEESQNRLYTSLREWADLMASSVKDLMEASHAGEADYYNELAKLNLTGKGGPGAGTYVVIDNAGTSDAEAHYEYLDERAALERQLEIEQENAKSEAWRKVWDDLNAKMNEQITDWINAQLQNQAVYDNTKALKDNTDQDKQHLEILKEQDGIIEYATDATRQNTDALGRLTTQLAQGITINPATDTGTNSTGEQGDVGIKAGNATGMAVEGGEQSVVFNDGVNPGVSWMLTDEQLAAEQAQLEQRVQMQEDAAERVRIANEAAFHSAAKTESDTDKQMVKSNASSFAKMTMAANLYGVAYQAVSNDNLSATQKWEMIALQSVGNYAISSLTAVMSEAAAKGAVSEATVLGKLWSQLGWAAAPVFAIFTGLLGAAMGAATSKVAKSKSQIAQATGASSASAGKLTTGMLTYAEGNVNEFTDPDSLTPGRSYNVDAADGKTYRAKYTGRNPKTHITTGPEFHLVGEKGREAIIDAHTTRNIQLNEPEIWRNIQTLYNGGSLRHTGTRRGRGVRAFADGNVDEFEMSDGGGMMADSGLSPEMLTGFQSSLDRNSAVMERIEANGIKAYFDVYGKGGLVDSYDTGKKTVQRHGERY